MVALAVVGCGGGIDYTCADIEASSEKEAEADAYLVDKLNEALADAPESRYGDKGELAFEYTQGADAACAGIEPGPSYEEPAKPEDKVQPLLDKRVRAGVNWYRTGAGLETGGNTESDQSSEEDEPTVDIGDIFE